MTVQTIAAPGVAVTYPSPPAPAPSRIVAWVDSLSVALKAAETIVDTPLCPDAWWPLPPNVKLWNVPDRNPRVPLPNEDRESYLARRRVAVSTGAVVLSAAESLGLDTMAAAITGVYVVGGKPALYAEAMLALLHTRGWRSRTIESSETRAAIAIWRTDEPAEQARTYSFTIEQAERAGYVKGKGPNAVRRSDGKENRGGNEQYDLRPDVMLWSRAVTLGCRREAPEVLKGMTSVEERRDELSVDDVAVTVVQPVTSTEITAPPVARGAQAEARTAAAGMRGAPSGLLASAMRREAEASVALDRDEQGGTHSLPEAPSPEPEAPKVTPAPVSGITEGQKRKLGEAYAILDVTGTGQRIRRAVIAGHILGKPCGSVLDLTEGEAEQVLARLTSIARLQPSERAMVVASMEEGRGQAEPTPAPEPAAAEAEPVAEPVAEYDPTVDGDPWANVPDGGEQG